MPVLIDAATSTPSVLLVRSRWSAAIWLFPKGGVDGGESAKAAAVRETLEEAGVAGEVWGRKLGVWDFVSTRQKQKMWLLRVTDVHDSHSKKWKEVRAGGEGEGGGWVGGGRGCVGVTVAGGGGFGECLACLRALALLIVLWLRLCLGRVCGLV